MNDISLAETIRMLKEDSDESMEKVVKDLFAVLVSRGLLYHIDDDPSDMIDGNGKEVFTAEEAAALNDFWSWVAEEVDWDTVWDWFPMEEMRKSLGL